MQSLQIPVERHDVILPEHARRDGGGRALEPHRDHFFALLQGQLDLPWDPDAAPPRVFADQAQADLAAPNLRGDDAPNIRLVIAVHCLTQRHVVHFEGDVLKLRQVTQ